MSSVSPWPYECAVVTGGSRGIGFAVATRLLAKGVAVHAIARASAALDAAAGAGCYVHPLDIADAKRLTDMLADIAPDILVNNAGHVHRAGPLPDLSPEEIDSQIDVNLRAPLHAMRACLPAMMRRKRGHIVNLGSVIAESPFPGAAVYGASKAAMHFLGHAMRYDLAGSGVRFTTISPGRVDTGIHGQAMGAPLETVRKKLYDDFRVLHAEDVAAAVMFALEAPAHVDVSFLSMMSTEQATGGGRFEIFAPPAASES